MAILSLNTLQQILVQNIYHLPPDKGGMLMLPGGLLCGICMGISAKIIQWAKPKTLIFLGIVFLFAGTYGFHDLSPTIDSHYIIWLDVLRSIGLGLSFVPLTVMVFNFLDGEDNIAGAGVFNLVRNLGSSIGVSLATTLLSQATQVYWHHLISFLNPFERGTHLWMSQQKIFPNANMHNPAILALWAGNVSVQSFLLAFGSTAVMVSFVYIVIFILVGLMKTPKNLTVTAGE
jgi:DHA2 family multidrug resistance protein